MTRAYVIDAGSLAAWLYFANKEEADGMLNAVHRWFVEFVDQMKPSHYVVCLDSKSTRREAIDAHYKIGRKAKPKEEAFVDQLRRLPDFLVQNGVPTFRAEGEEADDCIASIVTAYASEDVECWVVSSDKDLGALVGDHVKLYDPRPDKEGNCRAWDAAGIEERLGVPPWRVADFLAMAGDSSDDIPGIPGIGKKYALVALRQTKSMAELWRKAAAGQLDTLKPAIQEKIAGGRADFEHCMKLVQLRTDIPVPPLSTFAVSKGGAA